jgi:hypothetical protein
MKKLLMTSFLIAATIACAACSRQQVAPPVVAVAPAFAAMATTRQLMLGLTIPASDVLFQVGEKGPADDAGWDRIVANALMLAESGQLLLTGARDLKQPEWKRMAEELTASAKAAADAAATHNVDLVLEAGNRVYESCDACHTKYMPAKAAEQATQQK